MKYEQLERSDSEFKSDTVGLSPGIAGVHVERKADVFCPECAPDIVGEDTFDRVKSERVGYDHPRSEELGNVVAVLASEEWDCPGVTCGHCGIELDVKVIHYEGVCGEHCPEN